MKMFKLCFNVTEVQLPTFVALVSGECMNFSVVQIEDTKEEDPAVVHHRRKRSSPDHDPYTNRADASKTRMGKLVLEKLTVGQHFHREEVEVWLESWGYSRNSASAILFGLEREGKIQRTAKNSYRFGELT